LFEFKVLSTLIKNNKFIKNTNNLLRLILIYKKNSKSSPSAMTTVPVEIKIIDKNWDVWWMLNCKTYHTCFSFDNQLVIYVAHLNQSIIKRSWLFNSDLCIIKEHGSFFSWGFFFDFSYSFFQSCHIIMVYDTLQTKVNKAS